MSEASRIRHSPGPWRCLGSSGAIEAQDASGRWFEIGAAYRTHGGDDMVRANARLMASAPMLLRALREAEKQIAGGSGEPARVRAVIRAAIAQATGGDLPT
jgi:hypothetical protein